MIGELSDLKTIYILYEHISREYESAVILKKELESYKFTVYIYQIYFEFHQYALKSLIRPADVVVIPWLRRYLDFSFYSIFTFRNHSVKFLNLNHEQISSKVVKRVLLPNLSYTINNMYHISWGHNFEKSLVDCGVPLTRIFTTGNIRNDSSSKESKAKMKSREIISSTYNLDINKAWVIFAENRGMSYGNISKERTKFCNMGLTSAEFENILANDKLSLECFYSEMSETDPELFREVEFIYRPHPGTLLSNQFGNLNVHMISDYSIYQWLYVVSIQPHRWLVRKRTIK
jgi:hypothetical protein